MLLYFTVELTLFYTYLKHSQWTIDVLNNLWLLSAMLFLAATFKERKPLRWSRTFPISLIVQENSPAAIPTHPGHMNLPGQHTGLC